MIRRAMSPSLSHIMSSIACLLLLAGGTACAPNDDDRSVDSTATRDEVAARLARLHADDASWPTRVWLESPLVDASGEVLVKPKRPGVLVFMRPNGDLRVDFGRHGPHTVPVTQTNFVDEAARYRSGEATKTHPNLLAMLMNRVVEIDDEQLRPQQLDADVIRGGRLLLVFADPASADVQALTTFASEVERAGDVRLTAFVPITDELDRDVLSELRAGGWQDPFVMTPMARSYVPAMLEPGTPRPFARLSTDEGRILAEGPPDDATLAAMREALGG
jgi:hypothetical protein